MSRPRYRVARATVVLVLLLAAPALATPIPGWLQVSIPATGSYYWRYLPQSADPASPLPVILFLHGSGTTPDQYQSFVRDPAETAKAVIVLPKSSNNLGWGFGQDDQTVAEALRLVKQELPVDDHRVAIAGHSAGGAYAYLLAYTTISQYSAVFTLSAPNYAVATVADPAYRAPIRMYYGTTDPNYSGGGEAALKVQWDRLQIPWQEDVQAGFGHNSWPVQSMTDGFLFVVGKTYTPAPPPGCLPGPATLCLQGGRFRVEVIWHDHQGGSGPGQVVTCSNDGSGLFWFFAPDNWELMLKVIDGCALNEHFWVFSAATTDVGYDLTVTDTKTGQVAHYSNPPGKTAPAITDTAAFSTCP